MKIPSRIIAPIILAFVCAGALIAFIWWQLYSSASMIPSGRDPQSGSGSLSQAAILLDSPTLQGDVALVHLRQGDIFALRGEWAEAEVEYQASVDSGGGLTALRKLAQAQLQRRDMDSLEDTVDKLRSSGARNEDLLLLESIINLRTGELVAAKDVLTNADESPQKHYGLSLLAIVQGDHQTAQQELQLTINGWDPVLRSYATILNSAYEEYALFPQSSNEHLITLVSRALAEVQECELALPLLVQVTQTKDDYRDAWIVQGYCELTTERFDQSLASLERAYNLDPQKPEIQYFLGRAYAGLDQYQNAITFLEYALTNGFIPESEVRRLIARYALQIGNAGLALEQYDLLTQAEDATFEMYEGYVLASLSLGHPDEAFAKAEEATERWPDDARSFDLLAEAALRTKKMSDARDANEKALELNPNLESAQERKGQLE